MTHDNMKLPAGSAADYTKRAMDAIRKKLKTDLDKTDARCPRSPKGLQDLGSK